MPRTRSKFTSVRYMRALASGRRLPRLGPQLGESPYALYLRHRFALRVLTIALQSARPAGALAGRFYVAAACNTAPAGSIAVHVRNQKTVLRLSSCRFPAARV